MFIFRAEGSSARGPRGGRGPTGTSRLGLAGKAGLEGRARGLGLTGGLARVSPGSEPADTSSSSNSWGGGEAMTVPSLRADTFITCGRTWRSPRIRLRSPTPVVVAAAAAAAAAAASRCSHEENPYFHGWLIGHPEMSPPDYSMALSYSPEYASGAAGLDHSHYGGVPPGAGPPGLGGPRPVKRRGTANRKERRRTQSINSAFAELRECIPNVPADTKLSKIKTLRLATSYIAYLMDLLAKDDQNGEAEAFKAEIKKTDVKEEKRKKELNEILKSTVSSNDKKTKGRTGWPQHVWALELKQ